MAPRLYLPLRSSSSTSRPPPAAAPTFAAPPTSSRHTSRHVPGAPAPPARPLPAFHSSVNSLVAAAAAQPIRPTQVRRASEARLHGTSALNYSSSGSLHHHDPGSVCLSAMVHEFLEEEEQEEEEVVRISSSPACGRARCNCADGVCGDETCAAIEPEEDAEVQIEHLCEILEGYTSCTSKAELHLLMEVGKAMEEMAAEDIGATNLNGSRSKLRRPIMRRLREMEYNAAACKSRWNHGDGLPAGDYEYIDVIMEGKDGKEERIIVDIDFKAQFEIARPSIEYSRLLQVVPKVFVGRAERVKQVVKTMSQAAKRSLQAQGLLLPPWRKSKYMRAKWLSPIYRRTTNTESTKQYVSLEINRQDEEGLMCGTRIKNVDTRGSGKRQMRENSEIRSNIKDDEGKTFNREGSKEKVVKRGFEVSELHKKRPGFLNSTREVCTAMCTSWQLPCLEDKSLMAPRVSALSIALKQQQQRNPSTISVVS